MGTTGKNPSWPLRVAVALLPVPAALVAALVCAWRDTDPWWGPWLALGLVVVAWLLWAKRVSRTIQTWRTRSVAARVGLVVVVAGLVTAPLVGLDRGTSIPSAGKRVAVVGGGAAGLHSAWLLSRMGANVTVYEASPALGGHASAYPYTDAAGTTYRVDLGFMFGAPGSYKEMKALLALEGVGRNPTTLGLTGHVDGQWWATGMANLDAEVLRFQQLADESCEDPTLNLVPFGAWLWWHGFDDAFRRQYIVPLMSVLFITDHGLYKISTRFMLKMIAGKSQWVDFRHDAPAWTVQGSSAAYYEKLAPDLHANLRLLNPVTEVRRLPTGHVRVLGRSPQGATDETYDAVVLAVHADVARTLLKDSSWLEDFALGQVRYHSSEVVLHSDHSAFPGGDLLRAYTYVQDASTGDSFELNSLPVRSQGDAITLDPEPVVTLNPTRTSYPGEVVRRTWRHHVMDLWHLVIATQVTPHLQGNGNVWYAGDWVQFIGHGQAVKTGLRAACGIAGQTPAQPLPTEPCVDVSLVDATVTLPAERQTMCGEADVVAYLVQEACVNKGVQ